MDVVTSVVATDRRHPGPPMRESRLTSLRSWRARRRIAPGDRSPARTVIAIRIEELSESEELPESDEPPDDPASPTWDEAGTSFRNALVFCPK